MMLIDMPKMEHQTAYVHSHNISWKENLIKVTTGTEPVIVQLLPESFLNSLLDFNEARVVDLDVALEEPPPLE